MYARPREKRTAGGRLPCNPGLSRRLWDDLGVGAGWKRGEAQGEAYVRITADSHGWMAKPAALQINKSSILQLKVNVFKGDGKFRMLSEEEMGNPKLGFC